jgi:hypothetical protein
MKGVGTRDLCVQGVEVCETPGPAVDYSPQCLRTISGLTIFCCFNGLAIYSVVSAGVILHFSKYSSQNLCSESRSRVIPIVMM